MSEDVIEDQAPELNPRQKLVLYMSDMARNFAMRWVDLFSKKSQDSNLRAKWETRRSIHVYTIDGSNGEEAIQRSICRIYFAQEPSVKQTWFAFSMIFGIGTFVFTTMDGFVRFLELAESSADKWTKSSFWIMTSNIKGIECHEFRNSRI